MRYREKDPVLFWMILTMTLILILTIWFFCKETFAAEPVPAETERGVIYLLDKDHAPATDTRRTLAHDIGAAIDGAAQSTNQDPWLITSMVFHESSFQLSACGKKNERGLLQVHGAALKLCQERGLDPTANLEQSASCGAVWLSITTEQCGFLVRNWDQCRKTKTSPACDGGMSAYLSGFCAASTITGPRVAARLRTRDKMLLDVTMPIR